LIEINMVSLLSTVFEKSAAARGAERTKGFPALPINNATDLKAGALGLFAIPPAPASAGSLLTVDVSDDVYGEQSVTLWPDGTQSISWLSAGVSGVATLAAR
jgi:hypothetical protein